MWDDDTTIQDIDLLTLSMEQFEKILFERNDDDWFVSDFNEDVMSIVEYRIYEKECDEDYLEYIRELI